MFEHTTVLFEKLLGDGLDVERLVVALLDRQRRQAEQVRADGLQVQQGQPLGGRAEAFLRSDRDAAEQAAFLAPVVVLDVEEVPALLRRVGEDEQGVGVVPQEPGDDGSFVAQQQPVGGQAGVDHVEGAVLPAAGEQHRVFGQGAGRRIGPPPSGEGPVDALVVQLAPEQFLERVQAAKVPEEFKHGLLAFNRRHNLTSTRRLSLISAFFSCYDNLWRKSTEKRADGPQKPVVIGPGSFAGEGRARGQISA